MLVLKQAVEAVFTPVRVTFDGPVQVTACQPASRNVEKDRSAKPIWEEVPGLWSVSLAGFGFMVKVNAVAEIPVGAYKGARCMGTIASDRNGKPVWKLASLEGIRDGDGAWQAVDAPERATIVDLDQGKGSTGKANRGSAAPAQRAG